MRAGLGGVEVVGHLHNWTTAFDIEGDLPSETYAERPNG